MKIKQVERSLPMIQLHAETIFEVFLLGKITQNIDVQVYSIGEEEQYIEIYESNLIDFIISNVH